VKGPSPLVKWLSDGRATSRCPEEKRRWRRFRDRGGRYSFAGRGQFGRPVAQEGQVMTAWGQGATSDAW
jgi:hypothetical protein